MKKAKPKVLFIDNEFINLKFFEMTYHEDFVVFTAPSGEDGLEVLRENNDIKFIISDMQMPEMNGLQFINEVKKKYSQIPCMLLSGYDKSEEIINALNEKIIVGYFVKPFNNLRLRNFVLEYLEKS